MVLEGVEAAGQVFLALHHSGVDHLQEGAWQVEVFTLDKTVMAQRQVTCQVLHTMIGMTDLTDMTDTRQDLQLTSGRLSWTAWVLPTTKGRQGKLTLFLSKPCQLLRYFFAVNLGSDFGKSADIIMFLQPLGSRKRLSSAVVVDGQTKQLSQVHSAYCLPV